MTRLWADGPDLGNLNYAPGELFSTIAAFRDTNSAPRGHGFVAMHKGYLVVIFSNDGGGGDGSGGFTFYNVANPRSPQVVFTTLDKPAYTNSASPNYAGDIREAHGYSFYSNYVCLPSNRGQGTGLQFWDWTNVDPPNPAPTRVSRISLPGLTGGDYAPTAWWVFWQGGRYAYVAGTSAGIFIVDATNPGNPVLVDRGNGLPNPIPNSQTGGFRINTMFVVGNTMVVSASDASGLATLDVSDPKNPVLLDSISTDTGLYSIMVNGDRILGAHDPAWIFDIGNPANITLIGTGPNVADKGGYGIFQDGIFHYGSSSAYVKLEISSLPPTVVGMNAPSGFANPDWDFATPLGNLVFQGNDHSGSALIVHQTWPDTNGPLVNMIVPHHNAVSQALSTRVGLTFTDQIDLRTLSTNTCFVRPLGGQPLPGRYSHQTGIVNFWPDQPLQPNTTYEVAVPAGGIKDWVGNAVSQSFTSRFSTINVIVPLSITASPPPLSTPGQSVNFSANSAGSGTHQFSWNFGDGTPPTAFNTSSNAVHTYTVAGHYSVTVTVTNGTSQAVASFVHTVHHPLTPTMPAASGTILLDAASNHIWCVNADSDTVTAMDASSLTKLFEKLVGKHPRTLAQAPDGTIWVINQEDATISVLNRATGNAEQSPISLPHGSRPYGIAFSPNGNAAYVTLQGTGKLLRFEPASRTQTGTLDVNPTPRGIAVSADSQRVFVSRFISPNSSGEVTEVEAGTFAVARTFQLGIDPGPDLEDSGRGLPNYLSSIAISPDGLRAWIPSKKDNILRGLYRDGESLTFESTVRTIVSQIDLVANTEDLLARIDLNDRDMAFAASFSPLGDYFFVAVQGANSVDVFDAYTGDLVTAIEETGLAPQGLALSPDGSRMFVQNFMSRSISVYDTSGIVASTNYIAPLLGTVSTVSNELLSPQVLLGKQIFYNAEDNRMNHDHYLSCASCHLDGEQDGRVWDFTDRGEGLRNTVALVGRSGTGHGRVHWSANFDEIQDFEHDIRNAFDGDGFMSDDAFNIGTRNQPLGEPKAGVSPELDALAAYVSSLTKSHPSPFRNGDGSLTADGVAGKAIFASANCAECHTGNQFTDSNSGVLHDVGTIRTSSGHRLGQPLTGLDTPTLKGIWETAPYFHDGSAPTLYDVFANTNAHHGALTAALAPEELQQLIAYLRQIDDSESVNLRPDVTWLTPADGTVFATSTNVALTASASDSDGIRRVEFFANGVRIGEATNEPFAFTWLRAPVGVHQLTARATDYLGDSSTTAPVAITIDPVSSTLIAHLTFDDGTGKDSSGKGNHGALLNGASVTEDVERGRTLVLDGDDDFVDLGADPSLDLSDDGQATIAAWVKIAATKNHNSILTKGEWRDAYSLLIKGDSTPNNLLWTGSDTSVNSADAIPLKTWTHVAVTINGNQTTFYVNGTASGPANQDRGGPIDNNPLDHTEIGREDRSDDGSLGRWYFNGLLDDVRLYATALTPADIQAAMSAPINQPPTFTSAQLVSPPVMAGQSYAGSLAGDAIDPNPDDLLLFSKLSGPGWLSITSDGSLSGKPRSGDVGTNHFVVRVVDLADRYDEAELLIAVTPAPPILLTINWQGADIWLDWVGGIPPYQVRMTTNLNGPWQVIGDGVSSNNFLIASGNATAFYRVGGQ